ncbi:MAG TPA: hypothetical protein EYN96_01975 [Candidatus Hydrogenedentes bacterium]|nr:hypothetical protein [Candidatus Hydrogenedentota bacterium]
MIVIGDAPELFVDDYLIDTMNVARLKLWEPGQAETVLEFDNPWEGRYAGYVTVLHDAGKYWMYYRGLPIARADGSDAETTCYAESTDGVHWTKPELGIVKIEGQDTNIILSDHAPLSHNFSPFIDANPDAETRYKAISGTSKTGLMTFASADGIHWKRTSESAIITEGAFDSQNVGFWSEKEGQYVCYFRVWSESEFNGYRSIARSTSSDFVNWSAPVEMSYGDSPREHLYTNQTHPYFRNSDLYIAIAARFMPGRRVVDPAKFEEIGGEADYSGDCSDSVFMTSRGGGVYDRTFMEGFVRPGIGLNNWSSRTNYPALGVVPTGAEEMSFYIQRNYGQTSHHLQRMVMRVDGFVSVHAPYSGGSMATKAFTFSGERLLINFSTSAAGSLLFELRTADGARIPGYGFGQCDEILGDETERVVTWNGTPDVSSLQGKPVRLHVRMKDADLFSIRFR